MKRNDRELVVGLDVGTSKVCAIVGEQKSEDGIEIIGIGFQASRGLKKGVVVNIESACHFADRGQFLREVRRILRPGGRVAGMDWLTTDNATAEQRELYVEPFCDQWALGGLESLSSYAERLRDSDLTVLECTGFDGRDIGNLRLVEYYSRTLKGLSFIGLLPARYRPVMRSFRALELIWQHRCFETGRYCAIKPAGG